MKAIRVIGELNNEKLNHWLDCLALNHAEGWEVTVCSEGGDLHACFAFLDLFKEYREAGKLDTVAVGWVMSGAPVIVASGSPGRRFAFENTAIGLHLPFILGQTEDSGAQDVEMADLERTKDRFCRVLESVSNHTRKWWRKTLKGRSMVYFDPREAVKLGLIDTIL